MFNADFPSQNPLVRVSKKGSLYVMLLQSGDNTFSSEFMAALHQALDYVEKDFKDDTPAALITTNAGRIFSNGLDVNELMARKDAYFSDYQILMERILGFRMPTIAAINGHAYAGGLMFALAHDYRLMKGERGFLCMNEIDIPAALTPGMVSLLKCKIENPRLLRTILLTGARFDAKQALENKLIDDYGANEAELHEKASKLGQQVGEKVRIQRGDFYRYLKLEMYSETSRLLRAADLGYVRKANL